MTVKKTSKKNPYKSNGGARKGAGRPKKKPDEPAKEFSTMKAAERPLDFLVGVMNDEKQKPEFRLRAAITAAQYSHNKVGDSGKKDEQSHRANKAGAGRFASGKPPMLKVVGRKK